MWITHEHPVNVVLVVVVAATVVDMVAATEEVMVVVVTVEDFVVADMIGTVQLYKLMFSLSVYKAAFS